MIKPHKELPHSIEAEESLLSCCFLDGTEAVSRAMEAGITRDSFYDARNGLIYATAVDLFNHHKPVDVSVVAEELKTTKQLDAIGGISYLVQVSARTPTMAHLTYYIDKVRENSILRNVIRTSTANIQSAYEFSGGLDEFVDVVEKSMMEVTQSHIADRVRPASAIAPQSSATLLDMIGRSGGPSGIVSGFKDLDVITWGFQPADIIILAGRPSTGKAQPLTSRVLTPAGFVPMGTIKVGDFVIGADGKPKTVLGVFPQGKKTVYRVQMSDGSFTRCCAEHLWFTQTRNERRRGCVGSVKDTATVSATIHRGDGGLRNHVLPSVAPVEFNPPPTPLPLDPWLLGALLGDGKLASGSIMFFKPEKDMLDRVARLLPASDKAVYLPAGDGIRVKRAVFDQSAAATRTIIDSLGVNCDSEFKFIPDMYKHASVSDRIALLQGLLDTDGHVERNGTGIEFSSSSKALFDDVGWLVRSLGGIFSVGTERDPKYTYKGEVKVGIRSYRAMLWFDNGIVPVSSEKHLAKLDRSGVRKTHRSIVSVTEDGREECQCIIVDSHDHLYLTDDFIPTHNTSIAMNIVEHAALQQKVHCLVFSLEMTANQLLQRMILCRARVNMSRLRHGFIKKGGDEADRIIKATDEIKAAPLSIDDSSGLQVNHLRARARRLHARQPLGLIAVDYLQLMAPATRDAPREQQVAEASRGLKALAKELNVPIIVLSQLNRLADKESRTPRLSDLRESGSIEQDADVVMMLSRPKDADENFQVAADKMDLYVAKQRNGPVGQIQLSFLRDITRFENYHGDPK